MNMPDVGIGIKFRALYMLGQGLVELIKPPSEEEIERRNKVKRAALSSYFGRVGIANKDKKLNELIAEDKSEGNAYRFAFASHALHSGRPRIAKGGGRRRGGGGSHSQSGNATGLFHRESQYRVRFRGSRFSSHNSGGVHTDEMDAAEEQLLENLKRVKSRTDLINEIHMVSGGIGCGKSTLLTNVYQSIRDLEDQRAIQRPAQTLRIEIALISFDELIEERSPEEGDMADLQSVDAFFDRKIVPHIFAQVKNQTNLNGSSLAELLADGAAANVILIFDDMDAIYRVFCRLLLTDQNTFQSLQGINKFYPFVFKLVSYFASDLSVQFGIRCVFGMRIDTCAMVETYRGPIMGGHPLIESFHSKYVLDEISGNSIKELVAKRIELAKTIEAKRDAEKLYERRVEQLESSKIDFEAVARVNVQGLRHAISLLQRLDWAFWDDELFERFYLHDGELLTFFLLDGYEHFSQVHEGVTNIFLINTSYRKEKNPPMIDGKPTFTDDFLKPTKQTYFLKYFVLLFVYQVESADKDTVVNLFSGAEGYERRLVELVLFSLSEVDHGRLIRPEITFSPNGKIACSGLESTTRGDHFVEKKLFWRFEYLAMVVEDHWLEVPLVFRNEFTNPIGSGHITKHDKQSYLRGKADYLLEKSRTVPLFLIILEGSLKSEMKCKKELFNSLERRGLSIPNFDEILENCRVQLIETSSKLHKSDRDEILSNYDEYRGKKKKAEVKKAINEALNKCH